MLQIHSCSLLLAMTAPYGYGPHIRHLNRPRHILRCLCQRPPRPKPALDHHHRTLQTTDLHTPQVPTPDHHHQEYTPIIPTTEPRDPHLSCAQNWGQSCAIHSLTLTYTTIQGFLSKHRIYITVIIAWRRITARLGKILFVGCGNALSISRFRVCWFMADRIGM